MFYVLFFFYGDDIQKQVAPWDSQSDLSLWRVRMVVRTKARTWD